MDPRTKLVAAAQQGDLANVKSLLADGADIHERDEQGWTALHWFAGKGDAEAIRLLLDHQADVKLTGRDNRTPLMVARAAGRREAVAILTDAEKAKGVWKDPLENKPYCKGYYLKQFAGFPQWPDRHNGQIEGTQQPPDGDSIVYLHQDFTVTKSVWLGESVLFNAITPEWIRFCEAELKFSIPADLG